MIIIQFEYKLNIYVFWCRRHPFGRYIRLMGISKQNSSIMGLFCFKFPLLSFHPLWTTSLAIKAVVDLRLFFYSLLFFILAIWNKPVFLLLLFFFKEITNISSYLLVIRIEMIPLHCIVVLVGFDLRYWCICGELFSLLSISKLNWLGVGWGWLVGGGDSLFIGIALLKMKMTLFLGVNIAIQQRCLSHWR